jgi:hypothetical protein
MSVLFIADFEYLTLLSLIPFFFVMLFLDQWRMLDPTRTARSSSSAPPKLRGWMENMVRFYNNTQSFLLIQNHITTVSQSILTSIVLFLYLRLPLLHSRLWKSRRRHGRCQGH